MNLEKPCSDPDMTEVRTNAKILFWIIGLGLPFLFALLLGQVRVDHLVQRIRAYSCALFAGFQPKWFYWQLACMLRIGMLILCTANLRNHSVKMYAMGFVLLLSMLAHGLARPYTNMDRNYVASLDLLGMVGCFLVCATSVLTLDATDSPGFDVVHNLLPTFLQTNEVLLRCCILFNVGVLAYGLFGLFFTEFVMEAVIAESCGCQLDTRTRIFLKIIRLFWSLNHVTLVTEERSCYVDSNLLNSRERAFLSHSMQNLLQSCVEHGQRFYPSMLVVALHEGFHRAVLRRTARMRARDASLGPGSQPVMHCCVNFGTLYQMAPDIRDFRTSEGVTVEELGNIFEGVRADIDDRNPNIRSRMFRGGGQEDSAHLDYEISTWGTSAAFGQFMDELAVAGRCETAHGGGKRCDYRDHVFGPQTDDEIDDDTWVCYEMNTKRGCRTLARFQHADRPTKEGIASKKLQHFAGVPWTKFQCLRCGINICGNCRSRYSKPEQQLMLYEWQAQSLDEEEEKINAMGIPELLRQLEIEEKKSELLERIIEVEAARLAHGNDESLENSDAPGNQESPVDSDAE